MSSDAQESRAELLGELARELRQLNGLSASYFRALAARLGVTVTDMQVIESLASTGPMTAGQLAELTGLTTGAITGMINRLEEAGLVRRERDPEDGRRVIVHLSPDKDRMRELGPMFDFVGKAWEEATARYDDEQIAFLVDFLKRGNALSREELVLLRGEPQTEEGSVSAPLEDISSGRLIIPAGVSRLTVRADAGMTELYQARFEGAVPEVKANHGEVTIRYPRRRWLIGGGQGAAEVALSAAIPWQIVVQGGASEIHGELANLNLAGLEVNGGMSLIRLELPVPSGVVPIRISGGASTVTIHRPAGVPARVRLKGWASHFVFDEQTFSNLGSDVRLQSASCDGTAAGYDFDIASSVSTVSITAG